MAFYLKGYQNCSLSNIEGFDLLHEHGVFTESKTCLTFLKPLFNMIWIQVVKNVTEVLARPR